MRASGGPLQTNKTESPGFRSLIVIVESFSSINDMPVLSSSSIPIPDFHFPGQYNVIFIIFSILCYCVHARIPIKSKLKWVFS